MDNRKLGLKLKGDKGLYGQIADQGTIIEYDPNRPVADVFAEVLTARDKLPPGKPLTQQMKEFVDAHFKTDEEKMKALQYYFDVIVPKIAHELL